MFAAFYFLNKTMSAYNVREYGIPAIRHRRKPIVGLKIIIKTYKEINLYFKNRHGGALNRLILKCFDKMMYKRDLNDSKIEFRISFYFFCLQLLRA